MLTSYFKLIRKALNQNRTKGSTYYESHHIIPKSFNKKTSKVLLTPEEHYLAHKYLAQAFKKHPDYNQKMLWAYHRLAFDKNKDRKLTKEEYGEARRLLMPLWKRPKSDEFKQQASVRRKGLKSVVHPKTKEIKYIQPHELQSWLDKGWENTNLTKGLSKLSEEGRESLSTKVTKRLTGKKGKDAMASKGPYTIIFEDGRKYTAYSFSELSKLSQIKLSTLHYRLKKQSNDFTRGFKVVKGIE